MSEIEPKHTRHPGRQSGTIRGARAAPPQLSARECPIEAMYEEHFIQRQLCADMELLAATTLSRPELARRLLVNLCRDLPRHLEDEEHGLFPRLRARALPEDELEKTLTRLAREHEIAAAAYALLVPALVRMADGNLPAPEECDALRRLASSERRHLIVENAILLPLARLRLSDADKVALMAEMCARRARPPRMDAACARALARIAPTPLGEPQ
ncbi:hemerythrin domain-containing protein [Rhodobacteraceae bacterium 2376]|uniref:Hemerythrin domain-containing protein n=1 Tax=Rhabdonatronobacter sediminivivens TaxID=2743469 RepID=A0A7Z0I0X2_9RHOB|nr:hemerythrin domain-containing protein [Rhabdonatronobacter sediminivivens]NYS25514.1 hemerythrin domain-containing protein [Rhabdonatronobacter sediminivivens]